MYGMLILEGLVFVMEKWLNLPMSVLCVCLVIHEGLMISLLSFNALLLYLPINVYTYLIRQWSVHHVLLLCIFLHFYIPMSRSLLSLLCLGVLSLLVKGDSVIYLGCYKDQVIRDLNAAYFTSDSMTVSACVGFCTGNFSDSQGNRISMGQGLPYAALQTNIVSLLARLMN
jgi:hypothetical protein